MRNVMNIMWPSDARPHAAKNMQKEMTAVGDPKNFTFHGQPYSISGSVTYTWDTTLNVLRMYYFIVSMS